MKYAKMTEAEKIFNLKKQTIVSDSPDLFELLKNIVCCTYISDLRTEPYSTKAQMLLRCLDLDSYSTKQVSDVCQYIGATL